MADILARVKDKLGAPLPDWATAAAEQKTYEETAGRAAAALTSAMPSWAKPYQGYGSVEAPGETATVGFDFSATGDTQQTARLKNERSQILAALHDNAARFRKLQSEGDSTQSATARILHQSETRRLNVELSRANAEIDQANTVRDTKRASEIRSALDEIEAQLKRNEGEPVLEIQTTRRGSLEAKRSRLQVELRQVLWPGEARKPIAEPGADASDIEKYYYDFWLYHMPAGTPEQRTARFDRAEAAVKKAEATFPQTRRQLIRESDKPVRLREQGPPVNASIVKLLQKAQELDPEVEPEDLVRVAEVFFPRSDLDPAVEEWRKAARGQVIAESEYVGLKKKGKIGAGEELVRTFGATDRGRSGEPPGIKALTKVPGISLPAKLAEWWVLSSAKNTVAAYERGEQDTDGQYVSDLKYRDAKQLLALHMRDQQEEVVRGQTLGAKTVQGLVNMPAYMSEYSFGYGLATRFKTLTGAKGLTGRALQWLGRGVVGASTGGSGDLLTGMVEYQLQGDSTAQAFTKAFVSTLAEYMGEEAGQKMMQILGGGVKRVPGLGKAWDGLMKSMGKLGLAGGRASEIVGPAWSGQVPEHLEERLSDLLRWGWSKTFGKLTGTEIQDKLLPSGQDLLAEFVSFLPLTAGGAAVERMNAAEAAMRKADLLSDGGTVVFIANNPEAAAELAELKYPSRRDIVRLTGNRERWTIDERVEMSKRLRQIAEEAGKEAPDAGVVTPEAGEAGEGARPDGEETPGVHIRHPGEVQGETPGEGPEAGVQPPPGGVEPPARVQLPPGHTFEKPRPAYRVEPLIGGEGSAAELVDAEVERGNEDVGEQAIKSGIDLNAIHASRVRWVTTERGAAERYGEPLSEFELPRGTQIIAGDQEGGYLVALPAGFAFKRDSGGGVGVVAEEKRPPAKPPVTGDFGTVDAPDRAKLSEHFEGYFANGGDYTTIVEARKDAGELLKGEVKAGTQAAKQVEEAIELGLVRAARKIVARDREAGANDKAIYDHLVDLLNRQPRLGLRTSTSVEQQAYSTPLPIAFVASRAAGITAETGVYEPSAGNGALLLEAGVGRAVANELSEERAKNLKAVGFQNVTGFDAAVTGADGGYEVVIANPPFGKVKTVDGRNKSFEVPGPDGETLYRTTEVDHAIAMQALRAMKPDGRAVLIVGSKKGTDAERASRYNGEASRRFYYHLYQNYNVVDHFTVDGKLYAKQGAGYPIDIIVIRGRGTTARALPAVDVPRTYTSFEQLKEVFDADYMAAGGQAAPGVGAEGGEGGAAGGGAPAEGGGAGPGNVPGPTGGPGGVDVQPGGAPGEGAPGEAGEPGGRPPVVGPESGAGGRGPGAGEGERSGKRGGDKGPATAPGKGGVKPERPATGGGGQPGGVDGGAGGGGIIDNLSEADRKRLEDLKKKFNDLTSGSKLTVGVDPEAMLVAAQIGGLYVKAGVKTFANFIRQFMKEFPHLVEKLRLADFQSIYSSTRYQVEAEEREGMSSLAEVDGFTQEQYDELLRGLTEEGPTEEQEEREPPTDEELRKQAEQRMGDVQVPYTPTSKMNSGHVLMPRNMVDAMKRVLQKIEEQHGQVDGWVQSELGWTEDQLRKHLFAEQVEAVAMALHNMERGRGFILGDQTGVGKGRVLATLLQWTRRRGKLPIFITAKPKLYRDMIRDLTNTGAPGWNPLVTDMKLRGKGALQLDDGRRLSCPSSNSHELERILLEVANDGLGEYDAVFTTYSQLQPLNSPRSDRPNNWRQPVFRRLIPGAVLLLDESHNAGGQGIDDHGARRPAKPGQVADLKRSEFVRELIDLGMQSGGSVVYSSATWSKDPRVMDLYRATNMLFAVPGRSPSLLATTIQKGGIPMQQILAPTLSEDGQYVRRELDYSGIDFPIKVVPGDVKAADASAKSLLSIHHFSESLFGSGRAIDKVKAWLAAQAGVVLSDPSTGTIGVQGTHFSSLMHNLIGQGLLAMKAEQCAVEAIEAAKRGEKPIIALSNTMGAAIERYAAEQHLVPGDVVNLTFNDFYKHYLQRSREVTVKDVHGNKSQFYIEDKFLDEDEKAKWEKAQGLVKQAGFGDVPVSPIDYVMFRLREAGLKVDEITGRMHIATYSREGDNVVAHYHQRSGADKSEAQQIKTINGFNSGRLDALVVNRSASEGVSMHASAEFKDQKPRHMFILQPEANIDWFMQMLGRIHRTGQVALPKYTMMLSDIPAEKRIAAVNAKKLAGLNANVEAEREGKVTFAGIVDIMNWVGDEVVADYLTDNPDIHADLGWPLKQATGQNATGLDPENAAQKATGYVAMLDVEAQNEFYEAIEAEFKERIALLNATGQNSLIARTLDLDARTIKGFTIFEGDPNEDSGFARGAQIEYVDIKRIGKPHPWAEVQGLVSKELGLEEGADEDDRREKNDEYFAAFRREHDADYDAYIEDLILQYGDKSALVKRHENGAEATLAFMRDHAIGDEVQLNVSTDGQNRTIYFGVITKVDRRGQSRNPYAPSVWRVHVAVADAARELVFPVSKTIAGNQGGVVVQAPVEVNEATPRTLDLWLSVEKLEEAFAKALTGSREKRYIATGNIMASFSRVQSGQIILYTTSEGQIQPGVLLPKTFDMSEFEAEQPVPFRTREKIREFFGKVSRARTAVLTTPDQVLSLMRFPTGTYRLLVPSSKQAGGKYYLNKNLRAAVGDFATAGGMMRADFDGEAKLEAVLTVLYEELEQTLEANVDKDVARNVLGLPPISAKRDKKDDHDQQQATRRRGLGPGRVHHTEESQPGTPASFEGDPDIELISAHAILAEISRTFDMPAYGRLKVKAAQAYFDHPQIVRSKPKYTGDLDKRCHELAHHILNLTGIISTLTPAQKLELKSMDYKPDAGREEEGWAEYLRIFLTENTRHTDERAGDRSPYFHHYFVTGWLRDHADYARKLMRLKELIVREDTQGALARAGANISKTGKPERPVDQTYREWAGLKFKQIAQQFYRMAKEEGLFLWTYQEAAKATGLDLKAGMGPYDEWMATTQTGPTLAQGALEDGVMLLPRNPKESPRIIAPPFRHVFEKIPERDVPKFEIFCYARHAREAWDKGKNPGITRADADYVYEKLWTPEFEEAADRWVNFDNAMLDVLVEAGVLRPELAALFKKTYRTYMGLRRVVPSKMAAGVGGGGKKLVNIPDPIRRRFGSGFQILDPIQQTIERTIRFYTRVTQQLVMNRCRDVAISVEGLHRQTTRGPESWMVREAPGTKQMTTSLEELLPQLRALGLPEEFLEGLTRDQLDEILHVYRADYNYRGKEPIGRILHEGKPELWRFEPDMFKAINAMPFLVLPRFLEMTLGKATRLRRLGATGLSLTFLAGNIPRDYGTWFFNKQLPHTAKEALKPPAMMAVWVASEVQRLRGKYGNPTVRLWQDFGGELHTYLGLDMRRIRQAARDITLHSTKRRLYNIARHPADAVRQVLSFSEVGPRLAEFESILKKHGYDSARLKAGDMPPLYILFEAINAAGDVTVNFKRMGSVGKYLNRGIVFFNANLEGPDKHARTWWNRPKQSLRRALVLAAANLVYWYGVKDDDWYKEAPPWLKYGYYTITDAEGKPVVRIPRAYEVGMIVSGSFEMMLNVMEEQRPDAIADYGKALGQVLTPPMDVSIVGPMAETFFNYDFFLKRNIVSPERERMLPPDQYTDYNTEFSVAVCRWLWEKSDGKIGISPAKMEHFLDSMSGGMYSGPIKVIEAVKAGEATAADIPFVKRFALRKDYSKSTDEFYVELKKAEQRYNSARSKDATPVPAEVDAEYHRLARYADLMSDLRRLARPLKSRSQKFVYEKYIIGLGRHALGQEELDRYPFLFAGGELPEAAQEIRDRELELEMYALSASKPERVKTGGVWRETEEGYKQRLATWEIRKARAAAQLKDYGIKAEDLVKLWNQAATRRGMKVTSEARQQRRRNVLKLSKGDWQ